MLIIGLGIHRDFAEVVVPDGADLTHLGRVEMTREHLTTFAANLETAHHAVLESTGNTTTVVDLLSPVSRLPIRSRCT